MFEKAYLENHFYSFFENLGVITNEVKDIIKCDLVLACVIVDIPAVGELYVAGIYKKTNNTHKKDMLELIC